MRKIAALKAEIRSAALSFRSPKCEIDFDAATPSLRYLLVHLTLDPEVFSIEYDPRAPIQSVDGVCGSIHVVTSEGRQLLSDDLAAGYQDPTVRLWHAAQMEKRPYCSNASQVWMSRNVKYSGADQVRVLAFLDEEGPTPLVSAAAQVRDSVDPISN